MYTHTPISLDFLFMCISRALTHYRRLDRLDVSRPLSRQRARETRETGDRALILYVQYIHFRFPGHHHAAFVVPAGDVDVDRLSAALQNGNRIPPNSVRYSRRNKHFCWKWWKVEERASPFRDAAKFDFPASQRGLCFQEKRKGILLTLHSYFAHNLHNSCVPHLSLWRKAVLIIKLFSHIITRFD